MTTHYETLGVTRASTKDEIRAAYLKLAKEHHPDMGGDATLFTQINAVFKILYNNESRSRYNDWLDECFTVCNVCKGKGATVKQKSFKFRVSTPCAACKGSGVV